MKKFDNFVLPNSKDIKKRSGIYVIRNSLNRKVYIGQAVDLEARCRTHLGGFKGNPSAVRVANKKLLEFKNENPSALFYFDVVTYCEPKDLNLFEQFWMDATKCYEEEFGFNSDKKVKGFGKTSDEVRDVISLKRTLYAVNQINEDGSFVKSFRNAAAAAKELKLTETGVFQVCKGFQRQTHGYFFEYSDSDNSPTKRKMESKEERLKNLRIHPKKPTVILNDKNQIIKEFESVAALAKFLNTGVGWAAKACHNMSICKGQIVRFKNSENN